jgi:uncharacterized protein YdaU (DUF1376 family)
MTVRLRTPALDLMEAERHGSKEQRQMSKVNMYMPFWVGDYLADTMHLSTVQHGAYVLLILAYWRNGKALPNDEKFLRTVTKLSAHQWEKNKHDILSFFEVQEDFIYHGRIEKELKISHEKRGKAKKSAGIRWNGKPNGIAMNNKTSDANAYANASPEHMRTHMRTQCSSYIDTNKSKDRAKTNNYSGNRKNKLLEQLKQAGSENG